LLGKPAEEPPSPPISTAERLQALDGDRVFFGTTSFLHPYTGAVWDAKTKKAEPTVVRQSAVADLSRAEGVEEAATSKDGAKVPMLIVRPKGLKMDGRNPVVLTGYGGFGISQSPYYSDLTALDVERGVVMVLAILRGGGEFGEAWHDAGRLTKKQN